MVNKIYNRNNYDGTRIQFLIKNCPTLLNAYVFKLAALRENRSSTLAQLFNFVGLMHFTSIANSDLISIKKMKINTISCQFLKKNMQLTVHVYRIDIIYDLLG